MDDDIKIKRTKCTEKLWMPKIPNYDETTEYFVSKNTSAALPNLYNSDDISGRDVFTKCEITKKKLHRVEKKHAIAFEKAKLTREELNKQWSDLEKKEIDFRKNFTFFDEFVKENEAKRVRALSKLDDMNFLIEKRCNDIAELKEHFEDSQRAKADMDTIIKKLMLYEDFLKAVKYKYSHLFNTETDIIKRYSSLLEARKCVGTYYERSLKELEDSQKKSMKLMEEKKFIIMGLNNQIANLQARFENATIRALEGEQLVIQIKNNAAKQMNEIDETKVSIWNIFQHMTLSKKHPTKIKKENVEEQMMYIKRTLTELARVNKIIKRKSKSVLLSYKK